MHEATYAATRRRLLAFARDTKDVAIAERVARISSTMPSSDRAEIHAALTLGRWAADSDRNAGPLRPWCLLSLVMAAFRAGDDVACDEAFCGVIETGKDLPIVIDTASFFRAMSLHRRGQVNEARRVATDTAARMKPLPDDAQNPLAGDDDQDDLVMWLAFREAKALIGGFDATKPMKPDAK